MDPVVFVGDELSAAGWRLAGVRVVVPQPGQEPRALADARATARLVLVGAPCAARIPPAQMRAAAAALSPLLVVVPDVTGREKPADIAAQLRAQLGMEP